MPIPQLKPRVSSSWKETVSSRGRKGGPGRQKITKKALIRFLIKWGLILLLTGVILFALLALWVARDLPKPNELMNREVAQSTKIYDRSGQTILYEISGEERRTLVTLNDIPDYVEKATIAIEDKTFYNHGGFSLWAMFRTVITNVVYRRSAGGSTLTQQFIKNAVLSNEKTITRKIKELILAYQLEKKFSKDEILQMYLNEIPYGSNAYGVEAASQKYFGKSVRDVSLGEAAVLAALPQSPSRYSPYGQRKDLLLGRKDYILELMAEQGYISATEKESAQAEEIVFKPRDNNMVAPHFVMYIKELLTEKYGEKMVEQGGLKIYTTLDTYKQALAEKIITEKTASYPEKYRATNAALVSIDPKTGQVLAMVGSRDFFNDEIDGQVNIATSPRQPGSSMKPIVYAALFELGYNPDTILYDVVTDFSTNPADPYRPHNYDLKEYGPVSIRQALAGSLNIPAVKAIYLVGIERVLDLADGLGYTTLYPRSRFGLSLVLGGGEVKLLEHVNAYSAFARDGLMSPVVSVLKIEDREGNIIEEYKPNEKKVLDSQVARMINSVLSDNNARSFVFGNRNYLTLGDRPVAAKTGTTNDFHDAWTIGYTPSLVTGVWVGNNDNQAMSGKADGSVLAAPIWNSYMSQVLGNTPAESFKTPDDYKTGKAILDGQIPQQIVIVDKISGLLATESTPKNLREEKSALIHHSILFYVNREDPKGPTPKSPENDPQFSLWEKAVQNWASKNASTTSIVLPTDYDTEHNEANKPLLEIISPANNQAVESEELFVQVEASAPRGLNRIEYYLNGNLWQTRFEASTLKAPFNLNNGYQTLTVRACDDIDNCTSKNVNFNVLIDNNQISASKNLLNFEGLHSGLALNSSDFPITIVVSASQPPRLKEARLMIKKADGSKALLANASGGTSPLYLSWQQAPSPGSYSIYVEGDDWNGGKPTSEDLIIVIGQ